MSSVSCDEILYLFRVFVQYRCQVFIGRMLSKKKKQQQTTKQNQTKEAANIFGYSFPVDRNVSQSDVGARADVRQCERLEIGPIR